MQRIPSTQALRALESFSRHGTVWEAAEELCLTRSAVSHQLRLLERELGFSLFNRVGTRIELNTQGQAYAKDIRNALALVADSALRNSERGLSGQLTVSCTPGFASTWLCTHVFEFHQMYPDIDLSVVTPKRLDDVTNPTADLFVVFGDGQMSDVEVELLQEVEFTPLLSPALLNRLGGFSEPADVFRGNLMHLVERRDWYDWLGAVGLPLEGAEGGIVFSDMNLLYAAALNAQGIVLGDEFICHQAMKSGQLVRPFELAIKSPKSYYLAIPHNKSHLDAVSVFRHWLMDALPVVKR